MSEWNSFILVHHFQLKVSLIKFHDYSSSYCPLKCNTYFPWNVNEWPAFDWRSDDVCGWFNGTQVYPIRVPFTVSWSWDCWLTDWLIWLVDWLTSGGLYVTNWIKTVFFILVDYFQLQISADHIGIVKGQTIIYKFIASTCDTIWRIFNKIIWTLM